MEETKIIETGADAKDGQTKCPKCGATDISLNAGEGKLRCNFCRYTFDAKVLDDMKSGVGDLKGDEIGSGAADIDETAESMVTLKCTSCGAEVVINLNESSQARCHWCRNMLSINSKVPNGTVPDVVLPFKMKKAEAQQKIDDFVGKRKFFANPHFRREFTSENIMGVYFPYMLVDMKGHATFTGEGEIEKSSYEREKGDNQKETVYKVERYSVARECDVEIDDLTVESSARRAGKSSDETNNIINAILPFDTENCVKYDANYLKGFSSEKRDVNKKDLQGIVDSQEQEAVKFALNDSVKKYDRGVHWDKMDVKKEGEKWLAAYLPVWLYSYVENAGTPSALTHYVAVNARTSETIGSVPVNKGKMWGISILIGLIVTAICFVFFAYKPQYGIESGRVIGCLIAGLIVMLIFFGSFYSRYRNTGARHHFEKETKISLGKIAAEDGLLKKFETTESSMRGANNTSVKVAKLE